jgi:hypothetical protein
MGDEGQSEDMDAPDQLLVRTAEWLALEGYPVEYQTATVLRRHGFRVHQGIHTRSLGTTAPREVDVVAQLDGPHDQRPMVRVEIIAECKWSRDKPWVVFTSPSSQLHPTACIAQTVANDLGSAALSLLARNPVAQKLPIFETPVEGGFGGRQAFSKGNDVFYSALAGVTSAAASHCKAYSRSAFQDRLPEFAACAFPIVVVDGPLFLARFDEGSGELELHAADSVRCHWRGAPAWELHATVDVVRLDALESHIAARKAAYRHLVDLLVSASQEIATAHAENRLEELAERGGAGVRRLLLMLRAAPP